MTRLSQETIAIIGVFVTLIGVSVALGALIVTTTNELRDEIQAVRAEGRADRETIRAEGRADRETIRAEGRADRKTIRAEGRADREALEKRMAQFEEHIIRLTERQSALGGLVEGLRHRQMTAAGSSDTPG